MDAKAKVAAISNQRRLLNQQLMDIQREIEVATAQARAQAQLQQYQQQIIREERQLQLS